MKVEDSILNMHRQVLHYTNKIYKEKLCYVIQMLKIASNNMNYIIVSIIILINKISYTQAK